MEDEFYTLLHKTPDIKLYAFENNWPYILQATRNGLLVYNDNDSRIYYTKRNKGEQLSTTVVVNALGKNRKDGIKNLAVREKEKGITTIVKNIDREELGWWTINGFVETFRPWSKYSFRDDNTYPQYLLFRNSVVKKDFGKDIKWQIKKFDKNRKITTELYNDKYDESTRMLLKDFSLYSENKGNDSAIEIERGHLFFFDTSIRIKIRLQHIENNQFIGFSFLTPVEETIFYNVLICKNEKNLMKYLIYQGLSFIISNYPNIRFFGMQGSEKEGQDYLKRRFHPSIIVEKTHLIYQ